MPPTTKAPSRPPYREHTSRLGQSKSGFSMRVRAAREPVWPIVFDPSAGRLYTSKSVNLLLGPFRPGHKNEIASILRLADFEGGTLLQCYHFATLPIAARHPSADQNEAGSRGRNRQRTSTYRLWGGAVQAESRAGDFMATRSSLAAVRQRDGSRTGPVLTEQRSRPRLEPAK